MGAAEAFAFWRQLEACVNGIFELQSGLRRERWCESGADVSSVYQIFFRKSDGAWPKAYPRQAQDGSPVKIFINSRTLART